MAFPIIPVVATLGTAGLAALVFGGKKTTDEKKPDIIPEPTKPSGMPAIPAPSNSGPAPLPRVVPAPIPTPVIPRVQPPVIPSIPGFPSRLPVPAGTASGRIIATSGLWLRDQPNTAGRQLTLMPFNSSITILNPSSRLPPTTGAPNGWWKVKSSNGIEGFASAQYVAIGNVAPLPLPKPAPGPIPNFPPTPTPPENLPFPPSPLPPTAGKLGKVTAQSGLNVRNAPNTAATILQLLPYGTAVTLAESKAYPATPGAPKGWYRLARPGSADGYASAEFISLTEQPSPIPVPPGPLPPAPPPTPENMPNMGTVTAKSGLNIRNQPNTTGTVLATMPLGSRLIINGPQKYPATSGAPQGWYKVTTSTGITGYASVEFVNMDNIIIGPAKMEGEYPFDKYYRPAEVAGEFNRKTKYSITG